MERGETSGFCFSLSFALGLMISLTQLLVKIYNKLLLLIKFLPV